MKVDITHQLVCWAACLGFGLAAGLLYRLRARLSTRRTHIIADALLDLAYWLIVLPGFTALILTVCGGELRLYHLCSIAAGAGVCALLHRHRTEDLHEK